jgi:hypothetical protein
VKNPGERAATNGPASSPEFGYRCVYRASRSIAIRSRSTRKAIDAALVIAGDVIGIPKRIGSIVFRSEVAEDGGNEPGAWMRFDDRAGDRVHVEDIDRSGALGERLLERAEQLPDDGRFEWIEHVDDKGCARPGELSGVAGGDLEVVAGPWRTQPNGKVAAGLGGEAGAHLNADDLLKGVKRGNHDDAAHTSAKIEESVGLKRRIGGRQERAPGIDSAADHGGRAGGIANIVDVVRMTRREHAALNAGRSVNAVLEVEGVGLQTAGPYDPIGANGIVAETAEGAAILERASETSSYVQVTHGSLMCGRGKSLVKKDLHSRGALLEQAHMLATNHF